MITTGRELNLESLGLHNINQVHRNLSVESLIEETIKMVKVLLDQGVLPLLILGNLPDDLQKINILLMNLLHRTKYGGDQ